MWTALSLGLSSLLKYLLIGDAAARCSMDFPLNYSTSQMKLVCDYLMIF